MSSTRHAALVEVPVGQAELDRGLPVGDPVAELATTRPHDVLGMRQPERHVQEPGLVHVTVVLVDHRDLEITWRQGAAEAVGRERAAPPAIEHDETLGHRPQ